MQNFILVRWLLFIYCGSLTVMLIHQSWMNLIRGKISIFSIDRLSIWSISVISKKWGIKVISQLENNPRSIRVIGVYALIGATVSLFVSIEMLSGLLSTH